MGSIFNFSSSLRRLEMEQRPMRPAMSSSESTFSASFMRRSLPNWFISTFAPGNPFTFSNSSAGPPGPRAPARLGRPLAQLGRAVGNLRHLQIRARRLANPFQFACLVQLLDPVA